MLTKNYSTATILFAANVIDGGKKLDEVPASFKADVSELVKTLAGNASTTQTSQPAASQPVTQTDVNKQTVVVKPADTATKEG